MPALFFEIGVEELPATSLDQAMEFMQDFAAKFFANHRINHGEITTLSTPRRLVLAIADVAEKQSDLEEEVLGPSLKIAYESTKVLSKAGLGFLRAKGLKEEEIFVKATDKGEVIAAKVKSLGQETKTLLPSMLLTMMREIPFKKRMRWDSSKDSFARPIRWMVALFGEQQIKLHFADVESGELSYGHRFLAPTAFKVSSFKQYQDEMAQRFVILKASQRAAMIKEQSSAKISSLGGFLHEDDELLDIVKNLAEYPFVILGSFPKEYLEIPKEILISEMKTHQKCFAIADKNNNLLANFICVAGTKPYDEEVFAAGNARVLRARFEDGAFYFAEDQKKTLAEHAKILGNIVFERELGTLADKTERIEKLAKSLGEIIGLPQSEISLLEHAANLLKADLATGVVGQFPELQGVMGSIYGQKEGLDEKICQAIKTHYWPRFSGDHLPDNILGSLLSLADKLDSMVGIIAIGKGPKGNKDPFALRRNAIAVIRIINDIDLKLSVNKLIELAVNTYPENIRQKASLQSEAIREFIWQRARGILVEDLAKTHPDTAANFADGVLAANSELLTDAFSRAKVLHSMNADSPEQFQSLVETIKRASNIVKKNGSEALALYKDEDLAKTLILPCEKALLEVVNQAQKASDCAQINYQTLLEKIVLIKPKLDSFFDEVMVMAEDERIKNARLALLGTIKTLADKIADFTHL